jgi:hypothetical protein
VAQAPRAAYSAQAGYQVYDAHAAHVEHLAHLSYVAQAAYSAQGLAYLTAINKPADSPVSFRSVLFPAPPFIGVNITPEAPDLGAGTESIPVHEQGGETLVTPIGFLGPFILTTPVNRRPGEILTTPIWELGPTMNAAAPRKGGGANDAPSWVAREAGPPKSGETAQGYATRILNEKYGEGNWKQGGGSEYSQIVKWVTRGGRLS